MLKCKNLEREGCHPKVIEYKKRMEKAKSDNKGQPGDNESFIDVVGDLDEICRQCESHFFWIEEKECPICEGHQFKKAKGFDFYKDKIKIREDSFIECRKCGTVSRLIKWLS